jgi:hypothetical protein
MADVTGQQRILTPPDPTFAFVGGSSCRTLDFVIPFWIVITFYTLLSWVSTIRNLCQLIYFFFI